MHLLGPDRLISDNLLAYMTNKCSNNNHASLFINYFLSIWSACYNVGPAKVNRVMFFLGLTRLHSETYTTLMILLSSSFNC